MIRVKLRAETDENTGTLGLVVVGRNNSAYGEINAATEGLLIAHDLIEHVNGIGDIGSIDDELEALGGIWYVRGQHCDLRRDHVGSAYTIEQNIASDVVRMFRDHAEGKQHVSYAPLITRPCALDDSIMDTLNAADNSWRFEFNADEVPDIEKWLDYRAVALHRMRIGYRKARRRWDRHGRFAANTVFWSIAEAVQPHCARPEYEGAEYLLTYDRTCVHDARCEQIYLED